MEALLKRYLDEDLSSIVVCDLDYKITYMNENAVKDYQSYGGSNLIGKSLVSIHNPECLFKITEISHWFSTSKKNNIIRAFYNEQKNCDLYMIAIRDEQDNLIGFCEKQEYRNKENIAFFEF